jgi:hypothetical protein
LKKIAIFVEGQTERIFMLRFLSEYLGENKIEIRMEKRLGNRGVKYLGMRKNPYAEFYILVYDVGGDGNVVSAVKERSGKMLSNAGYSWILALRDLYPNSRTEKKAILEAFDRIFFKYPHGSKLRLILAVMEIEAWFLADHDLFERIHSIASAKTIKERLNIDLINDDPESYDHPAERVKDIFSLFDEKYKKKEKQSHKITANLDYNYLICSDVVRDKVSSFHYFIKCLDESLG